MVCEAFGGGVFAYVAQLCNDMCQEFDVYLAYSFRPQTPKNYKEVLEERVHLIQVKSFGGSIFNIAKDIQVIKELRSVAKDVKPDLIHLHSSIAGGLGRLAFSGKNIPVVYTPHGYAHILMGKGGLKLKGYEIMEKVLGKIKKKCKNGIKPIKNDKFTVYTLGRTCVQKQPELFNRIAELVPEARFVWIGGGELDHLLTAPNLELTGWKPRKEALAMGKGADVFILCSLGEAIAMSLIENMFMGKLILVSNVMGNKSVINNGVNGFVCDKAEDYAARIKEAMKQFPQNLCDQAVADVHNIYNTDAMAKKYVNFYNDAINGKYE